MRSAFPTQLTRCGLCTGLLKAGTENVQLDAHAVCPVAALVCPKTQPYDVMNSATNVLSTRTLHKADE